MSNSALQIEHLAVEKLEVFVNSIRPDGTYKDPIYKSVQKAGQQITSDYGSRFLVELVQNAYDAHSKERSDGRIQIHLMQEDAHGVLCIADKGHGFTWSDVESLCNIGMSNKPIGESIGNKGLGFRSVNYITDDPQVYSNLAGGPSDSFDGYCFRFAHEIDYDALLQKPVHRQLAKEDMPQFHIPIPLTVFPASALSFAKQGFTTVIRLPLRNQLAYQAVIKEIESIRDGLVPLLLFLQRLSILEIVVQGKPELSYRLARSSQPFQNGTHAECDDQFTIVRLGDEKRYFISWHMVPEKVVKGAIDKSIQQGQLHQSWKDWEGDGELAVAVCLDDGIVLPRLYTFLPMGEHAVCPFYGYLHGAFYPKSDRTSLDPAIPINGLYIDEAAKLCARTILTLRKEDAIDSSLSREERGKVIVDLLAWKQTLSIARTDISSAPIMMREAFSELEQEFAQADILPVISRKEGCWGKASEVWRWDKPDLKKFDALSLVLAANVAILSPSLGESRLDRLQEFIDKGDEHLTLVPTDDQLAGIAEKVAARVFSRKASIGAMKDYYLELEKVFRTKPISLSNRQILFCTDGQIRAAMSKEAEVSDEYISSASAGESSNITINKITRHKVPLAIAVFSPSKRFGSLAANQEEVSQILRVPKELTKRLAFLNDKLDWYGELEKVRSFLEDNKLVRRYDADDLIAQVSILARRKRRNRTRQSALNWVFKLWQSSRKAQRPISLRNARLLVPTIGGKWIEAEQAIFSGGWPSETFGDMTEKFLTQTGVFSAELKSINDSMLCHGNSKPFLSNNIEDWTDFLEAIGVNKGLQPLPVNAYFKPAGWQLKKKCVCASLKLGEETVRYWEKDIDENGGSPPYDSSQYELDGQLWYFPGQDQHSAFSNDAKLLYAQLILSWIKSGEEDKINVSIFTQSARWHSRFRWPTPLAAFLRQAPWFPMEIPDGLVSNIQFLKPSEVWLPNEEDSDHLPPYLPRMYRGLRRLITPESTRKLVDWCKANILNAQESLIKQVGYLARILAEKGIDAYYLQSFINLYYETWARLAGRGVKAEDIIRAGIRYLIIQQNGQPVPFPIDSSIGTEEDKTEIYVRDSDDELSDIIEKMGFRIFDSGNRNVIKVAALLRDLLKNRFRAVSGFEFTLLVDGKEYCTSKSTDDFAVNQCPWLPTVVYLAMESLTGMAAQHLPNDRTEIISRLHNIRLRVAKSIQFNVKGSVIDLPDNSYGSVAFRNEHTPLLLIQCDDGILRWSALARASNQLSQLLGQADLGPPILAAFRTLERIEELVIGPVPPPNKWFGELCTELRVDRGHAEKAIEGLGRDIKRLGRFLRPLVYYFGDIAAVELFTKTIEEIKSLSDLTSLLKPYLVGTDYGAEVMINICQRASGFGFIRDELNLSFGKFNQSLIAVGEAPDIQADSHIDAVHTFITCNKDAIMGCLRVPFIKEFKNRQTLQEYVRHREELETLGPKEAWLVDYSVPETNMVQALIDEWLAGHGAPAMNKNQESLPIWSKVRIENKLGIKRMVQAHGNKIKAWCYKNGKEPPTEWNDNTAPDNLCNALHRFGALDFDYLDQDDLIQWFILANVWPKGMPATVSIEELHLKQTDLDDQESREKLAKSQREKEARSIIFNNRKVDPQEVDNSALASEISSDLPIEVTSMKLDRMADLKIVPDTGQKHGTAKGGGGGKGGGNRSIHPDKADLIGFIGEYVVYHWLKRQLPQQDIDSSWMSCYRSRILPGEGDDTLGYDFKVRYKRHVVYLEVKSSLSDPQEFELSDTEVRLARDCATAKATEYRIVYVSNVQNTKDTRLEILPNPLSDEGKSFFRLGGHGLRYEFLRAR